MPHSFDRKFFLGGLNSDDEVRMVPEGDYLDANNIQNDINSTNLGGTLTNCFGNAEVTKYTLPYNGTTVMPDGINKTIGAIEDKVNNTVVFFNYNSEGKHGIYRWYKDLKDPANPNGEVQQVIQYDFGWTKYQRITAINIVYSATDTLLYWADKVPHEISLTRANICNKQKSWNIIAGVSNMFASAFTFRLTLADFAGTVIVNTNIAVPTFDNNTEGLQFLADEINANYSATLVAEACDCKLSVREVGTNAFNYILLGTPMLLVPDNWYGNSLQPFYFARAKNQPLNAPQLEYLQDTDFLPNYVQKKVFQSRLQYHYATLEGPDLALGVWSQIPINNLGCDGNSNELLNYIDIDFNDTELILATTLVMITEVRVIMRELNTGADRSVIDLEPCQFLDYVDGAWTAHFKFYNNIISSSVDPTLAAKLFENVPLEANEELYVKDRMIEGGILEGYDKPECPVGTYTIDFQENETPRLYKIKFKVRILTYNLIQAGQYHQGTNFQFYQMFGNNAHKYPFWMPTGNNAFLMKRGGIFHDITRTTENYPFFGGGGFKAVPDTTEFGIRAGMETTFNQLLPEGGFTVYAAGTPYFAVSKQIVTGLAVDSLGALDTSDDDKRAAIGQYLIDNNDLYSEVEILLPAGVYTFRVASHWCSFNDKLGYGFSYDLSAGQAYQQTSTNVSFVIDKDSIPKSQKEITLLVDQDISYGGEFIVTDVAPPFDADTEGENADFWVPINAYLYDSFGATDANAQTFTGISVERALVSYNSQFFNDTSGIKWEESAVTDHNGYFFGLNGITGNAFPIKAWQVNGQVIADSNLIFVGTLSALFNKTLQPYNYNGLQGAPTGVGLAYGIVTTSNTSARSLSSTFINGSVKTSTGFDVSGVFIVYETGRTDITDPNGNYSFVAWGDMITPNLGNFSTGIGFSDDDNRIVDRLIFELSPFCSPEYPDGQVYGPLVIDPFGGNPGEYNPDNPFLVPDFIVNENNNPAQKAHKRGGNYIYGVRYYDSAGRLCSVARIFDIYVPFVTEDLNVALPDQYPAGTFIYGKPVISWAIDFAPPQYAAFYQFMRTKNLIYGKYLQWVANQVTYISQVATDTLPEITTDFLNKDAQYIKISLSNIVSYAAANNDSLVSYTYQAGDRLRLVANRTITFYEGINDFEITSYDSETQSIIVKAGGFVTEIQSGTLLEIFNPKSVATTEEQIFYEVGEVFKCTNPGQPNNTHGTTSGTFTNGDTYWHGRLIKVNDDATKFASAYPVIIEDASISDFYLSEAQDIGRVGIIDNAFKQLYNPTKLRVSNTFLPSTSINGLCSFEELNQVETDRALGQIQRMFFNNNNIIVVNTLRELTNYIGVVTLQQATSSEGILAIANQYFGTQYQHTKLLGTDLPASCFINDGIIFGLQTKRGEAWRYQGDGEATISNVKMVNYFNQLAIDGVTDAISVYDRYHEEYILTVWRKYEQEVGNSTVTPISGGYELTFFVLAPFVSVGEDIVVQLLGTHGMYSSYTGEVISVTGEVPLVVVVQVITEDVLSYLPGTVLIYSLPETIAWFNGDTQQNKDRWVSKRSFTPECYAQTGSDIVSFKDGRIWIHNAITARRNNYYGVQYSTMVKPVFNMEPDILKVWNACTLFQLQADNGNDWAATEITNNNGQASRLGKGSWTKKAENWHSSFKRDLNDETKLPAFRLTQGRVLRSSTLTCTLENDSLVTVRLFEWQANWTPSMRTGK